MDLERGFRRVTLVLSLAGLCTGLGLTAHATYVTSRYVSAHKELAACLRATEHLDLDVRTQCLLAASAYSLPGHVEKATTLWITSDVLPLAWTLYMTNETYKLVLIPLGGGLFLSIAFAAATWGAFYLLRWIARGFQPEPG